MVQIRLFSDSDFEPLAAVLGTTWYAHHGEDAGWYGAYELCGHLADSQHGITACDDDGSFLGTVLVAGAPGQSNDHAWAEQWFRRRASIVEAARAADIDAEEDVAYLESEDELLASATARYGSEGVGIIVLIIVSPEARGRGVGKILLREGVRWLKGQGSTEVRLATSNDCDWQMYEHLGMDRLLEGGLRTDPGVETYIYQTALEDLWSRLNR